MKYSVTLRLAAGLILTVFLLPIAVAQTSGTSPTVPAGTPLANPSADQSLDSIAAVVNRGVILTSELDRAVAQIRQHEGKRLKGISDDQLRSQVLDQLIMRKLLLQKAKQDGIKVSKAQLQQGLAHIAQQNHMNLQQFAQAVQASGMDMNVLKQRVAEEITMSLVRKKEVMDRISVSDADVDRYLENQSLRFSHGHEYHLRAIRLKLPEQLDATTAGIMRDRLLNLRKQIVSGKISFANAARHISDGPHAANGGDMGWVSGSVLPAHFDGALAGLSQGEVSHVFQNSDGLYLIKLEGERGGKEATQDGKPVMVSELHLRHMVLKPNEIRNDAQTRKLALKIHERLQAGDDFDTLARKYSDDKATANQGGDLGWLPVKQLPPNVQEQIAGLGKGAISKILPSPAGYEIIKVTGKRERDQTLQAKRDKARQALGNQRAQEKSELWLHQLRDEAYLDIRMPGYKPSPVMTGQMD